MYSRWIDRSIDLSTGCQQTAHKHTQFHITHCNITSATKLYQFIHLLPKTPFTNLSISFQVIWNNFGLLLLSGHCGVLAKDSIAYGDWRESTFPPASPSPPLHPSLLHPPLPAPTLFHSFPSLSQGQEKLVKEVTLKEPLSSVRITCSWETKVQPSILWDPPHIVSAA